MALVSLKKQGDDYDYLMPYNPGNYPSGLCLYLDEDVCEALGIAKALKAGTELTIQAKAVVASATESLENDKDDKGNDVSLQIQITDMSVKAGGVMRNAAEELYGKAD